MLAQIAFRQLVLVTQGGRQAGSAPKRVRRWKIELHQKGLPVAGESCAEGIFPTVRDRTAYLHFNQFIDIDQARIYRKSSRS